MEPCENPSMRDRSFKPGLDAEDVLLQLRVLGRIKPDASSGRADRILQFIIDGLKRPAAGQEQPSTRATH
jgi:hypothetical protein